MKGENVCMALFVIKYEETYSDKYVIEADSLEEAKEKLREAIMNGEADGPEICVGSHMDCVAQECEDNLSKYVDVK